MVIPTAFIIHYHNKLETTQMASNGLVDKLWCIHTRSCSSSIKTSELFIHAATWMYLKCIMLSGRNQAQKSYIVYDSIYITFLKK